MKPIAYYRRRSDRPRHWRPDLPCTNVHWTETKNVANIGPIHINSEEDLHSVWDSGRRPASLLWCCRAGLGSGRTQIGLILIAGGAFILPSSRSKQALSLPPLRTPPFCWSRLAVPFAGADITVFGAASLTGTLDRLAADYQKQTPGIMAVSTWCPRLRGQRKQNNRFVKGDEDWMDQLDKLGRSVLAVAAGAAMTFWATG